MVYHDLRSDSAPSMAIFGLPHGSDKTFKNEYSEHALDGEELRAISGGVGTIATAAENSGANPKDQAPVGLDSAD